MFVLNLSVTQNTLKALLFVDRYLYNIFVLKIPTSLYNIYRRKENIEGDQRGVENNGQ